jgi:pyridoxamine 5'-phosphate oxidase
MDLEKLRLEYSLRELRRKNLKENPFNQFNIWLDEAIENKIMEPNAFVLATSTLFGQPSSRTVLLKNVDSHGFIFFTHYESLKGKEIEANPQVAATFLWKEMERQVNIQGKIKKTNLEISKLYFSKRPRASQLGALASKQSQVIASRDLLEKEYEHLSDLYQNKPIPMPKNWGGYIIEPFLFEFWQGRQNRLHDRFRYLLKDKQWVIERLSP